MLGTVIIGKYTKIYCILKSQMSQSIQNNIADNIKKKFKSSISNKYLLFYGNTLSV